MRKLIIIIIFLIFYSSCEEEINPFNYDKEETVIYGLINIKDSVQLVKVFKCYSTKEENNTSENYDLIKHYDTSDIDVNIEQWKDGEKVESIRMHPIYISDWDETHPHEDNLIYITKKGLYSNCNYRITVYVKKVQKKVWSDVIPFGGRNFHYQYYDELRRYGHSQYMYTHRMEENEAFLDQDINYYHETIYRFLYVDIINNDTIKRYVQWQEQIPKEYWPDPLEIHKKGQLYARVYNYLADKIPNRPNIERIPVGLDKMLLFYNQEIKDFNRNLSIPRSDFSYVNYVDNVQNGSGFVGVQYYWTYFAQRFTNETIDSLADCETTRDLNFIKYYDPFFWND